MMLLREVSLMSLREVSLMLLRGSKADLSDLVIDDKYCVRHEKLDDS